MDATHDQPVAPHRWEAPDSSPRTRLPDEDPVSEYASQGSSDAAAVPSPASRRRPSSQLIKEASAKLTYLPRNIIKNVMANTDVWLDVLDENANVVVWNKAAERISGYSSAEVVGHNRVWEWLYPDEDYRRQILTVANAIIAEGKVVEAYETRIACKSGEERVISWHSTSLTDQEGKVIGSIAIGYDVTERKRAEEALRKAQEELEQRVAQRTAELQRANEQLKQEIAERERAEAAREQLMSDMRALNEHLAEVLLQYQRLAEERALRVAELDATINAIADGVIIYNPCGDIVRMNAAAERILAYTDEEAALPLRERLTALEPEDLDGEPLPIEQTPVPRALAGETVRDVLHVIHRPPGRTTCISAAGAPILSEDGRLLGAVVSLTDVTRLRDLQRLREEYVHTISHDLRSPLTVIQGHAQLLSKILGGPSVADEVKVSIEAIRTAARRLNVMIQDLVDSTRLEGGRLEMHHLCVDLCQFVPQLLEANSVSLDTTRVRLVLPETVPRVQADPDRLERVFVNLLSNALKYSDPSAEVTVRVEPAEQEVLVSVIDRGPGIDPSDLPHIFDRFYRTRGPQKRDSLGLGLYITRMLVEAHRGRIWVHSEPGAGCTFTFTLPIAPAEPG